MNEKASNELLAHMAPHLNKGKYVFVQAEDFKNINLDEVIFFFRESEAVTIVMKKKTADFWGLQYNFIAAWITLKVNSSLEAIGLTAAVSKALAEENISANIVAAYHHDHLFVPNNMGQHAVEVLINLSKEFQNEKGEN